MLQALGLVDAVVDLPPFLFGYLKALWDEV
jgi:hypothetical protein